MAVSDRAKYEEKLAWLESLEAPSPEELRGRRLATRVWAGTWPVPLAIAIVLAVWELIHLSGWKRTSSPVPGRPWPTSGTSCRPACCGTPSARRWNARSSGSASPC